jgi:hypothetical protein
MIQPNMYVLEGGASNQVKHIIGQYFFLKSDINFIEQYIRTYHSRYIPEG